MITDRTRRAVIFVAVLATLAAGGCADDDTTTDVATDDADLIGFSTRCQPLTDVPGMEIERVDYDGGALHVRIGVMNPSSAPKGDVLYLHGFSDRFDNHLPLFEAWRNEGLRVIAFDYPSHGETCGRGIDRYRIGGLAQLAGFVEQHTREERTRPLVFAGWSTGGLVSVRMLQEPLWGITRGVNGVFLIAPGLDVKVLVGDKQHVTQETLTHHPNPPHRGAISPKSPLQTPLFSADLMLNAKRARSSDYPAHIPTLVVTGGQDEDVYADTNGIVAWVDDRKEEGARVSGLGCAEGRHELDNEIEPMGQTVRTAAARFATWAVAGAHTETSPTFAGSACAAY